MSFIQDQEITTISNPYPQFNDISFGGDGAYFCVKKNGEFNKPIQNVVNATEQADIIKHLGVDYKCVYLDYLVTKNCKISGMDIMAYGHHRKDFIKMQMVVLADPTNDVWVMYKEYCHKMFMADDVCSQKTPKPPYAKEVPAFGVILRTVYCIHPDNTNEHIDISINYDLHEVFNVDS